MNERQVTIDGHSYPLPRPFMVIATQNPVEHHGTYPLPESQLDRFLMRLRIGYPDARERARDPAAIRASLPTAQPIPVLCAARICCSCRKSVQRVRWTMRSSITCSPSSSARATTNRWRSA